MTSFLHLLKGKWYPPANPTASFAGKNVLITGSNVGLGFEAANKYVALGASRVILAVRNLEKGYQAKEEIARRNGSHVSTIIDVWKLDMDSFASVKTFAERVDKELEHLDVALLNAGLVMRAFQQSPEGWEETIQVNVLSTALLGLLLLPKLRASKTKVATPHLAIVSSGLHTSVKRENIGHDGTLLKDSNSPATFNGQRQYGISKLFVMYITKELASLASSPNGEIQVIVTSLCPGFCASDLGRQYNSWAETIGMWLVHSIFARTTEEGSRTLVSATTLGPEGHGKWWKNDEFPTPGELVTSDEGKQLQKSLWKEAIDVLKVSAPEVEKLAEAE
ncbi:MAG: hypothetical protein M1830_008548 [Pleopsidium flavum]|nr:MAG: hypothetical protein M1830_008548 [Pleopsidium flavum]